MPESTAPRDRGWRRRELLIAAGGALAAGAVQADTVDAMPPYEQGGDWLSGVVVDNVGDDAILVAVATQGLEGRSALPTRIWMASDHEASKEGPAPLSAFTAGERVVAHGAWSDGGFEATEFEPLYRVDDLTVTERRQDLLLTTVGRVRLNDRTATIPEAGHALGRHVYVMPLDDIRAGSRLMTMSREDPRTSELVAVRVGAVLG